MKQSEKKLLIVFGIGAFLLLNLLGWTILSGKSTLQNRQKISLTTQVGALNGWKNLAPEADVKSEWIQQNLTAYPDEVVRDTYLDKFFVQNATALGLDYRKNTPLEPKFEEHFVKSRYTGEVTGPWQDVVDFVYRLQQPSDFRFVPTIRITAKKAESDTEAGDAIAVVEIEKWWSPQSVSLLDDAMAASAPADESEQNPAVPVPTEEPPVDIPTAAPVADPAAANP